MKSTRSFIVCPNCGAPTPDAYCSSCGQRNLDLHVSLRALVSETIEELFAADSRFGRTLRALFFHPGFLSSEYRAGRRARYTSPIKLYLAASALYFFLPVGLEQMSSNGNDQGAAMSVHHDAEVAPAARSEKLPRLHALLAHLGRPGQRASAQIDHLASRDPAASAERKKALVEVYSSGLPRALFLLLPVAAIFLTVLYGRRRLVVDHMVFLLHTNAAIFFFDAAWGGPWIPAALLPCSYGLRMVYSVVYTVLAMRTMYEESWPKTVGKALAFLLAWIALVVGTMVCLFAVEFLFF